MYIQYKSGFYIIVILKATITFKPNNLLLTYSIVGNKAVRRKLLLLWEKVLYI